MLCSLPICNFATFIHFQIARVSLCNYSDDQITTAVDHVAAQEKCNPVEFDFKESAREKICEALRNQDAESARKAVTDGESIIARPWCMDLIKASCTFICSCGPTIIKKATFNLLDC